MRCVSLCFWCCCLVGLGVSHLNSIVENDEENLYILRLITSVKRYVPLHCFITFIENREVDNSRALTAPLQQRLMENYGRTVIVGGLQMGSLLRFTSERNLVLVTFIGMNDEILNVVINAIDNPSAIVFLFIYKPRNENSLTAHFFGEFFAWCWKMNIRFAIILFQRNNKFESWSYDPRLSMLGYRNSDQLIDTKRPIQEFRNSHRNKISIAVFQSLPDAFLYNSTDQRDINTGNVSLGGQIGLLLAEYLRYANGTMHIIPVSRKMYFNKKSVVKFDIGTCLTSNYSVAAFSPYVLTSRACLVLPRAIPVSLCEYLTYSRKKVSLAIFAALYFFMIYLIKKLANPRSSRHELLFNSLQLMLGQPLTSLAFNRLSLPEKFMQVFIQFYNALICGIICGFVSMYLTVGLIQPKIKDIDSFIESGLHIMLYDSQMVHFPRLRSALGNRLILVDEKTRNQHLYSLNDSYAYVMESHRWAHLEYIQRRLQQPKLELAPDALCDIQLHLRLQVHPEIVMHQILRFFINQVRETGLMDKWMEITVRQAELAGLINQAHYKPPISPPLPLIFFEKAFKIYSFGILLSLLAIILECIVAFWRKRRSNR